MQKNTKYQWDLLSMFLLSDGQTSPPPSVLYSKMPRAVSPARSEAEVDIFDSLTTDQVQTEHVHKDRQAQLNEGFGFLDNVDDDDDEAFIALKQAASYRKTTNLKGKTGQKSGGFQSMGMYRSSRTTLW